MPQNPQDRATWLTLTLYTLRGYFRDGNMVDPPDLSGFPSGKDGGILSCVDGRMVVAHTLQHRHGDYYTLKSLGTAYPPYALADDERRAEIRRVFNSSPTDPHPRLFGIIAHEGCGANKTLTEALLNQDDDRFTNDPEANFMLSVVPNTFKERLRKTIRRGASSKELEALTQQIWQEIIPTTALLSARHIHDYVLTDGKKVSDKIAEGQAHIVCAIHGLKLKEDKYPLSVFDPAKDSFVPIQALYDELFKGNNRRTPKAIEDKYNAFISQKTGVALPAFASPLIVKKGASSKTVAKMDVRDLDESIRTRLEKITHMKVAL